MLIGLLIKQNCCVHTGVTFVHRVKSYDIVGGQLRLRSHELLVSFFVRFNDGHGFCRSTGEKL